MRNKIWPNGILFLQETHSTFNDEVKWSVKFGKICFLHGTSDSCGVLIAFYGDKKINVKKRFTDNNGRILILDTDINYSEYINPNTEWEQQNTFEERLYLIVKLELGADKHCFSIRVFFRRHWRFTGQQGKGGTIFYSICHFHPPTHEHSGIYLQLCMWDDYHVFLIAPLVFTRLLFDDWLLMQC